MRLLFDNIIQIKQHISVDISQDLRTLQPYIKQAERLTKEITGKALHELLLTVVHDEENAPELVSLLEIVRAPLAQYAYMYAVPQLSLTVGEQGIGVTMSQNIEPAAKWRLEDFSNSLRYTGDQLLEDLIEFLEENKADYPTWASSTAYSFNKKLFVNNAADFEQHTMREIQRLEFIRLRESIHRFEQNTVKKVICTDLFSELKTQILAGTISPANQVLLDYIQPAVCYNMLFEKEKKDAFQNEATRLIEELQEYLNTNAQSYPLYLNSDCYSTQSNIEMNEDDSGLYIFG